MKKNIQTSTKGRKKAAKDLTICVCGLSGSGKSSLAKRLAEKYKLRYFSGGDALKALAIQEGYKNVDRGWWETPEGMRFLERRNRNHELDSEIDKKLMELAQQGNVMLDSWTMPWLLKKGFKIWLEASPETRAKRIAFRDGISEEEALEALTNKEKHTREIYRNLYGFDLGKDFEPFHLILDTDSLNAEEVFQILCVVIDNWFMLA
ncbi:MAG: cytidylate kinase family protein [Candidatus Bathyarchaeia archaeon]